MQPGRFFIRSDIDWRMFNASFRCFRLIKALIVEWIIGSSSFKTLSMCTEQKMVFHTCRQLEFLKPLMSAPLSATLYDERIAKIMPKAITGETYWGEVRGDWGIRCERRRELPGGETHRDDMSAQCLNFGINRWDVRCRAFSSLTGGLCV